MNRFRPVLLCLLSATLSTMRTAAQAPLSFDSTSRDERIRFTYPDTAEPYLVSLRALFLADRSLRRDGDLAQVLEVMQWTHGQWRHNGSNEPSSPDALTILREAKQGRNFRCVEYARVATDVLLALGFRSRVLALKTADSETRRSGAGHVLTEVWLPSWNKWGMVDAQFNLMPFAGDRPLNAVELQAAIGRGAPIEFRDAGGRTNESKSRRYLRFVTKYLHFLDMEFDQRMVPYAQKQKVEGHSSLMLVPLGEKKPALFQGRFPLDYMHYTHALQDFYRAPDSALAPLPVLTPNRSPGFH